MRLFALSSGLPRSHAASVVFSTLPQTFRGFCGLFHFPQTSAVFRILTISHGTLAAFPHINGVFELSGRVLGMCRHIVYHKGVKSWGAGGDASQGGDQHSMVVGALWMC